MAVFCTLYLLLFTIIMRQVSPAMEPFIVGGEFVNSIVEFPHSAFLRIHCNLGQTVEIRNGGASIINQKILLTAAHCYHSCAADSITQVGVGSKKKDKYMDGATAKKFKMHEEYSHDYTENDIALLLLTEPLVFSDKIKRVSLVSDSSRHMKDTAMLAGWGYSNEVKKTVVWYLKKTKQKLWTREKCMSKIGYLEKGTICGISGYSTEEITSFGYGAQGDSGSALVVNGYQQVGIVSFKRPEKGLEDIVVYTDVSYHIDWIKRKTAQLYCQ